MCKIIVVLSKTMSFDPTAIIFACRQFQCLHTLASIKIAKRRNLPSTRRNLPAKRRFFLPGSELDSRRALFLSKSVFFSNRRKLLLFWETALILHVGRSRYVQVHKGSMSACQGTVVCSSPPWPNLTGTATTEPVAKRSISPLMKVRREVDVFCFGFIVICPDVVDLR